VTTKRNNKEEKMRNPEAQVAPFPSYVVECLTYSISGMLMGTFLEYMSQQIHKKYPASKYLFVFGQLLTGIIVIYFLEQYLAPKFVQNWQSKTAGVFFVFFYFNSQPSLTFHIKKFLSTHETHRSYPNQYGGKVNVGEEVSICTKIIN
jgi:hypothetical protein